MHIFYRFTEERSLPEDKNLDHGKRTLDGLCTFFTETNQRSTLFSFNIS